MTPPRVFQDRNRCICKYNDVTEIYGQVLWLPVYFTLRKSMEVPLKKSYGSFEMKVKALPHSIN
jgi:hypothetical protein